MPFALILVGSFLLRVPKVDSNGKMKSVLRKKSEMLWTLGFSLFILWLLGFLGGYTGGEFIYILLTAAIVFYRSKLFGGKDDSSDSDSCRKRRGIWKGSGQQVQKDLAEFQNIRKPPEGKASYQDILKAGKKWERRSWI